MCYVFNILDERCLDTSCGSVGASSAPVSSKQSLDEPQSTANALSAVTAHAHNSIAKDSHFNSQDFMTVDEVKYAAEDNVVVPASVEHSNMRDANSQHATDAVSDPPVAAPVDNSNTDTAIFVDPAPHIPSPVAAPVGNSNTDTAIFVDPAPHIPSWRNLRGWAV